MNSGVLSCSKSSDSLVCCAGVHYGVWLRGIKALAVGTWRQASAPDRRSRALRDLYVVCDGTEPKLLARSQGRWWVPELRSDKPCACLDASRVSSDMMILGCWFSLYTQCHMWPHACPPCTNSLGDLLCLVPYKCCVSPALLHQVR